jgi:hypothetical protein
VRRFLQKLPLQNWYRDDYYGRYPKMKLDPCWASVAAPCAHSPQVAWHWLRCHCWAVARRRLHGAAAEVANCEASGLRGTRLAKHLPHNFLDLIKSTHETNRFVTHHPRLGVGVTKRNIHKRSQGKQCLMATQEDRKKIKIPITIIPSL